ncbi:MAG: hypothetical protein OWQ54_03720 [Sulfolobaceae archaeon]|nr:hypothetical protein [Sulfolobaceae archaeon]
MQKSNICRYYRSGYCTSPLLAQATDAVTSSSRCLGNYFTCQFYPDKKNGNKDAPEGLDIFTSQNDDNKRLSNISFYMNINVLKEQPEIECPYARIIKTDKGYIIKCVILNRVLTTSQANLCSKNWHTCPVRLQ